MPLEQASPPWKGAASWRMRSGGCIFEWWKELVSGRRDSAGTLDNPACFASLVLLMVDIWLILQEGEPINHGAKFQWPGKPSPMTATDS
jgi:hypothetical protein